MTKQIEIYKAVFPIESELIGEKNLQNISQAISNGEEVQLHSSLEGENISLHEMLELTVLVLKVIHEGYKIYLTTRDSSKTKAVIIEKTNEESKRLSKSISKNELIEMGNKIIQEIEKN